MKRGFAIVVASLCASATLASGERSHLSFDVGDRRFSLDVPASWTVNDKSTAELPVIELKPASASEVMLITPLAPPSSDPRRADLALVKGMIESAKESVVGATVLVHDRESETLREAKYILEHARQERPSTSR